VNQAGGYLDDKPVSRITQVPKVEINLVSRPDQAPVEAATAPVAAALANAVFDATGVRLRTVPFTPERVKAAIEKRSM
jgi:nicotinate dehydrogenase subunit B